MGMDARSPAVLSPLLLLPPQLPSQLLSNFLPLPARSAHPLRQSLPSALLYGCPLHSISCTAVPPAGGCLQCKVRRPLRAASSDLAPCTHNIVLQEFRLREAAFNAKYVSYFELHQLIQAHKKDYEALDALARDAPTLEDRQR